MNLRDTKAVKILFRIQRVFNQIIRILCIVGCFISPFMSKIIIRFYYLGLGILFVIALIPVTLRNALRLESSNHKIFDEVPTLSIYFASCGTIIKIIPVIITWFYPMKNYVSIFFYLYVLLIFKIVHIDSALEELIKLEEENPRL